MSGISTHVLDTAVGRPAAGIAVQLWHNGSEIGAGITDENGRCSTLLPPDAKLIRGTHRLVFQVASHYSEAFFPEIAVTFNVGDVNSHYHIPLLMSPFAFTTYRGS